MYENTLTIKEVASKLRVHPSTVRRWIEKGALDAITLPSGRKRVHVDVLNALLERSTIQEKDRSCGTKL